MDFEKEYYEDEAFWEGDMLQDPANQGRIGFTTDLIPGDVTGLCDIGCGNGVFANYLLEYKPGLNVMAIDRSAAALKYVRSEKKEGDVSAIPFSDASYDCVTCLEVIEHLPCGIYEKGLAELARVAKKYVIISVPFEEVLEERHNQCPSCKTIFNHDLHLRNFDDAKMNELLKAHGFSLVKLDHLGLSKHLMGHHFFRKLFYKEQFKEWRSPICPLCGFTKEKKADQKPLQAIAQKPSIKSKIIPLLTSLPKLLWPKESKYYWVIGLYRNNSFIN